MINIINEIFSNREIAIGVWLLLFISIALFKKDIRTSLKEVAKTLSDKLFVVIISLQIFYLFILVLFLKYLNYWNVYLLKDTIYWYLGVAFISFINLSKIKQDEDYVKKVLLDNLKFVTIIEFITNVYSFELIVEIFMVPIYILLVALSAIGETKDKYRQAKIIIDSILVFLSVIIIIFTIYNIFAEYNSFVNLYNLQNFFLSPLLTVLYMPFIFSLALYYCYSSLFGRLKRHFIKDRKILNYAKMKIFLAFHVRLKKLNSFSKKYYRINVNNRNDIVTTIKIFNRYYTKCLKTV